MRSSSPSAAPTTSSARTPPTSARKKSTRGRMPASSRCACAIGFPTSRVSVRASGSARSTTSARDRDVVPAAGMPVSGLAREEIMMGERERSMSQPATPGGIDAFLGKGTRVTGKLVFEGTGRIEGQVEGEISAQDTLIVGAGALVKASIVGTIVIIEGGVTGDVTAHQRLELRAASRVQGNIS